MGIQASGDGVSLRRGLRVAGVMALVLAAGAGRAAAADWTGRWSVGFRLGDYLPADEQKGGFRFFGGGVTGTGGNEVKIGEVPLGTLTVARGLKKWKRTQMTLELEVSRIDSSFGDETVYLDPDGSTRVEDPISGQTGQTGDESFESRTLGDVTMTPIFVNALFHWSGKTNPERADFYVGGGLGFVLADFSESAEYREFAGDTDGKDDVSVDNAFGVLVKTGANLRLAKNHEWFFFVEAEFIATGVVTSQSQISYGTVDYLAGTRQVDTNGDGVPDVTVPADYRLMDSGHVRMDGAVGGIGIRYRFGHKAKVEQPETLEAPAEPAPSEPAPAK